MPNWSPIKGRTNASNVNVEADVEYSRSESSMHFVHRKRGGIGQYQLSLAVDSPFFQLDTCLLVRQLCLPYFSEKLLTCALLASSYGLGRL